MDGMGVTGTAGVFSQSCEKTLKVTISCLTDCNMLLRRQLCGLSTAHALITVRHVGANVSKVLRNNKDYILTIVEVFLHDPLYKWTLSPMKALGLQVLCPIYVFCCAESLFSVRGAVTTAAICPCREKPEKTQVAPPRSQQTKRRKELFCG